MLNPSTADSNKDDNTVKRLYHWTAQNKCGGFVIANLFAYRSRDPKRLKTTPDPVGPDNNKYIKELSEQCSIIVCAWGNHGNLMNRNSEVIELLKGQSIYCLETTSTGQPQHPLFISKKSNLKKYE